MVFHQISTAVASCLIRIGIPDKTWRHLTGNQEIQGKRGATHLPYTIPLNTRTTNKSIPHLAPRTPILTHPVLPFLFTKKYESATCFFPFSSSRTSSSAEPLPDASRHEWIKYGKMDDYGVRLDSLNRNSLPLHMLWRTVQNCIGPFQFSHRIPYRSVHPAAP